MLEGLLNGKFVNDKSNINKTVVAMVYSDDGRTQGQAGYYRKQSLEKHLESKGLDLNGIKIISMENGRIFGVETVFDKVYFCKDVSLDTYRKLKEKYNNLEEFKI